MDEEEFVTVYQELVEILNELGLKEIVQEVSGAIQPSEKADLRKEIKV